jgi:AraC family transcriptional regulator, regulatory protein of adaptative response / DNA-3-methyladenine glycosylase II
MGFQGVVTTGIYCRPGCGGRPHPRNVRPFLLAAAAEAAGFRACLRCRPYRSDPPLSPEAPELVCRAVGLVVEGALDASSESALGARLGVSPRHLRRLFQIHLGVTPDQLARSRRAHFARRLLDDTDLSFADIAFASGFGSIRQFNRVCLDVFRASPRELRARRRSKDRLAADGGLALRLPIAGELAWDELLGYLERRAIPGVESVGDATYRRTVVVDGDPGVLEVSRPADDHLVLVAHLPHWEGLIHLVERARRIVSIDVDPEAAHRHLGTDPVIGPLIARTPGLRVPGTWDPFETAVRTVCGQRISVSAAMTIVARLVERLGAPVPGLAPLGLSRTFPSPEVVAEGNLDGLGLTAARVAALRSLARAVAEGTLALDRSLDLAGFVEAAEAIRGLGPWSAHYLALRLGYPDAFPAGDLGLRRALEATWQRPVAPSEVGAAAEPWRPYRALAATHLWFAPVPGGGPGARLAPAQVLP